MPENNEGTTVKLMTQDQAFEVAKVRWGASGMNPQVGYGVLPGHQENTAHVGWKEHGEWRWCGWGKTFEEAFKNVRRVKLHYRDKLEVYQ